MFGVAAGLDVEVGVVAGDGLGLHRILGVVGEKLLQAVENLLADEIALLDPSDLAGGGADSNKAAVVVEDLDAISVFDQHDFLIDRRDAVAEVDLNSGNVSGFEDVDARASAGADGDESGRAEGKRGDARKESWNRVHGNISI